jgi:hypothetical protein
MSTGSAATAMPKCTTNYSVEEVRALYERCGGDTCEATRTEPWCSAVEPVFVTGGHSSELSLLTFIIHGV